MKNINNFSLTSFFEKNKTKINKYNKQIIIVLVIFNIILISLLIFQNLKIKKSEYKISKINSEHQILLKKIQKDNSQQKNRTKMYINYLYFKCKRNSPKKCEELFSFLEKNKKFITNIKKEKILDIGCNKLKDPMLCQKKAILLINRNKKSLDLVSEIFQDLKIACNSEKNKKACNFYSLFLKKITFYNNKKNPPILNKD